MLKGIANTERIKFTLKDDKENPTIFWIRNIPHQKKTELWSGLKDADGKIDDEKSVARFPDIFIAGVACIENLGDNAEKIEPVTREAYDRFSFQEQKEVVDAVSNYNFLGKIEIKN